MLDWAIAAITIIVISIFTTFILKQPWTVYESFVCTALFAIFLKLKD